MRDLIEQAIAAKRAMANAAMGDYEELVGFVNADPKLAWEFIHAMMDLTEAVYPVREVLEYDRDPVDLESVEIATGYCIAQVDQIGLFRKTCKVIGGVPHALVDRVRRPYIVEPGDCDYALWNTWQEAEAVLESMDPELRKSFRIFPVLMAFGKEPKLLKPREEREEIIKLQDPKPVQAHEKVCPHCKAAFELPEKADANCENYGTNRFVLKHSCGNMVSVSVGREVIVYDISEAPVTARDDFTGESTSPPKAPT